MKGRTVAMIDAGWVGKFVHSRRGQYVEDTIITNLMLPDRPPPMEVISYIEDGEVFTIHEQRFIGFRGYDVV